MSTMITAGVTRAGAREHLAIWTQANEQSRLADIPGIRVTVRVVGAEEDRNARHGEMAADRKKAEKWGGPSTSEDLSKVRKD